MSDCSSGVWNAEICCVTGRGSDGLFNDRTIDRSAITIATREMVNAILVRLLPFGKNDFDLVG